MSDEKVWRGWARWLPQFDKYQESPDKQLNGPHPDLASIEGNPITSPGYDYESIEVVLLPATAYDDLKARVDELKSELEEIDEAVGEVYCNITNGKFSKANTEPRVILDCVEEECQKYEARIATLEAELAAKTAECERLTKQCDTCNGTGVMECLKEVLPPDEREVYEHAECGECHGTGVGWIGQTIAERDTALADLATAREELRHALNALAVIHRDGGHYTADHGFEKSCKDAADMAVNARVEIESLCGELAEVKSDLEKLFKYDGTYCAAVLSGEVDDDDV